MDKKNIFGCVVATTALVVIWQQTHTIQNRVTTERAEVGRVKAVPLCPVQRLSPQKQFPSHAAVPPLTMEARVSGLSAAIWQELNSNNEGGRETVLTKLLPELIALDPVAAAKLVEATTNPQGREELLRQLILTWATSDASAAFAWAGQLADPNEQESSMIYATKQMAELDPAAAAAAVGSLAADGQAAVTGDIALTWAGKDLTGALNWAASQPAGEQRDAIMARVAFVESRTAPEAAANLVIKEIPPGLAQEEAVISILHQWALRDFQAAKAWADRFPASQLLDRAMAELSEIASSATNRAN
ncbi:MAG: hypothetical protein ABI162_14345 [Luteolibacter sp.]